MSRVKKERLESIISRDLSEIIQFELKSPEIGFVTVTGVSLTNDYSIAKVYVTVLGYQGTDRSAEGIQGIYPFPAGGKIIDPQMSGSDFPGRHIFGYRQPDRIHPGRTS